MIKRLFLTLLFCLFTTSCFGAEFLVKAKPHWMDSFAQEDIDKLTSEEKQSYGARSQIGDIIIVRSDGWKWGKEECLPNFIVVKIPDLKLGDAKKYEEPLLDLTDPKNLIMLRHRKHQISSMVVENAKQLSQTAISIPRAQKDTFISNIIIKTGDPNEVIQPKKKTVYYWYHKIKDSIKPYLITAYNFYVKKCYAAQFLFKSVQEGGGGDYTTLEACMNANEQDLTGDGWFDVEIDGTWSSADTTEVLVHNYTTTVNDYINIYTTTTARHDGTANAVSAKNNYRMDNDSVNVSSLYLSNAFTTVNGIEIFSSSPTQWQRTGIYAPNLDGIVVCNNIIHDGTMYYGAIYIYYTRGGIFYNNIIYDMTESSDNKDPGGIYIVDDRDVFIYNNTVFNCDPVGIKTASANRGILKNNIANGNTTDYSGTFDTDSTTNITEDGSGPATGLITHALDFVSKVGGSEDFHLAATDTEAINAGEDLSATFTDDIDGDTRSDWDIGADEYAAAAAARRIILVQ